MSDETTPPEVLLLKRRSKAPIHLVECFTCGGLGFKRGPVWRTGPIVRCGACKGAGRVPPEPDVP